MVRDDKLPGGTKSRFIGPLLLSRPEHNIYYAGNTYGIAMLALALASQELDKAIKIFLIASEESNQNNPLIRESMNAAGNNIQFIPVDVPDYKTLIRWVRDEAGKNEDVYVVPPGFNGPETVNGIALLGEFIRERYGHFDECYSVYGSGALQRGLQKSGIADDYFAIDTLYEDDTARDPGIATCIPHYKKQGLNEPAALLPPYPSFPVYDAKAWAYALAAKQAHPEKKILLWNVAARPK